MFTFGNEIRNILKVIAIEKLREMVSFWIVLTLGIIKGHRTFCF